LSSTIHDPRDPRPLAARRTIVTELFRRQAVDYQRQKFHGAIVLTRSPWQAAVTISFCGLVLALVGFAATQGFARKESVAGVLTPAGGVLRLVAPQAGVVLAASVPQGGSVRAGEAVMQLSTEQSSAAGPTQEAVAQSLQRRSSSLQDELGQQAAQARQKAAALDARIASLGAGVTQLEREIALQRERVRLVREVADRYPALVKSGAVSPVEAAERATDLIDQQSHLAALERTLTDMRSDLVQARADRAALPLAAGRETAQLQREIQAIAQSQAETESHRESLVLAPQAGELAAVLAQPGQAVAAGQTLATLLPAGSVLEAELYVPTRAAGHLRPGMPVWLRVDAFPYARYGQIAGRVREVAQSAVPAAEAAPGGLAEPGLPGADEGPGVYRVRVALEAPAPADATAAWRPLLKPGMHVQASLVAEKRTLLQWALEPLAALKVAAQ
jgi:membrane fusion protein